jgi:pimeloyl-ACP methyl ester carboxylesterase
MPTTQAFRRIFGDKFFYVLYYQEPGPADAELNRDPELSLRKLFGATGASRDGLLSERMTAPGPQGFLERLPEPDGLPDWISPEEFAVYVAEFTRTGFTPALNWYRCFDRNWELMADTPAATITVPSLFIAGADDPTLVYTPRHRAREVVTGEYREVLIDGAGHWLPQERPDEVTAVLIDFLRQIVVAP